MVEKRRSSASYEWSENALISSLDIEKMPNGKVNCYLTACKDAPVHQLADLPQKLADNSVFNAYADVFEGKNVLVIPNEKSEDHLIEVLGTIGATKGQVSFKEHSEQNEQKNKETPLTWIKSNTLKVAGMVGLVGHASLLTNGIMKGDWNLAGGALGALNPIILSVYGQGMPGERIDDTIELMRDYFSAEGITLPEYIAPNNKRNFKQTLEKLVRENPIPIGAMAGSIGAANNLMVGLNDIKTHGEYEMAIISSTSLIGNTGVAFIPEKHTPVEERENWHANPLKRLWQEVQESPLRANGLLNITDNLLWGKRAYTKLTGREGIINNNEQRISDINAEINTINNTPLPLKNGTEVDVSFGRKGAESYSISGKPLAATNLDSTSPTYAQNAGETPSAYYEAKHGQVQELVEERRNRQDENEFLQADAFTIPASVGNLIGLGGERTFSKGEVSAALTGITAVSFGLSTALSAMSSTNVSPEEQAVLFDKMYAAAAKLLVQMPIEDRSTVLKSMSAFLSVQQDVNEANIDADKIREEIETRVNIMAQSPWLDHNTRILNGQTEALDHANQQEMGAVATAAAQTEPDSHAAETMARKAHDAANRQRLNDTIEKSFGKDWADKMRQQSQEHATASEHAIV